MITQDVKQIKIGKHMIGFVGLESTFEELIRDEVDQSDVALSSMLLERLTEKNYIPEKVREKYGRAFVREFKKFLGHAVEDEGAEGLVIKVLGAGCAISTVLKTRSWRHCRQWDWRLTLNTSGMLSKFPNTGSRELLPW
jgi:hypothetical protein